MIIMNHLKIWLLTGKIPMGIGRNCYIENAIIDKHVRIGDNVIIRGHDNLEDGNRTLRHQKGYCGC
jgi:ADP-glucose pyrophosphorylase